MSTLKNILIAGLSVFAAMNTAVTFASIPEAVQTITIPQRWFTYGSGAGMYIRDVEIVTVGPGGVFLTGPESVDLAGTLLARRLSHPVYSGDFGGVTYRVTTYIQGITAELKGLLRSELGLVFFVRPELVDEGLEVIHGLSTSKEEVLRAQISETFTDVLGEPNLPEEVSDIEVVRRYLHHFVHDVWDCE